MNILRGILSAFMLCSSALAAVADSGRNAEEYGGYPATFLRLEADSPERQDLATPVASYVNDGGQEVRLIGAMHVAEPEYYERLNKLFGQCDLLLFEMIGGEGLQRQEELRSRIDRSKPLGGLTKEEAREWNRLEAWEKEQREEESSFLLNWLGEAYKRFSKALNLQAQMDGIDYSPSHFVHADMTLGKFRKAQEEKKESFMGLMAKEIMSSLKEEYCGYQPNQIKMAMDLITGNVSGLKNELMRMLAYTSPDSLEDTVILKGRNAKCMEIFDQWKGKGARKIGIFYGAAHLPGLHAELLKRGYRLREVRWLTAWNTREQADGRDADQD